MTPEIPAPSTHGVTLSRVYDADPPTVFRAFADADALRHWWGPRDFQIETIDFCAVRGRAYRVTLRAPDGSRWAHEGGFLDVDPPRRLAYTWRWTEGPLARAETLVEVSFEPVGRGTRVTVSHTAFATPDEGAMHRQGWTDSFERVEGWLADAPARADPD